MNEPQHAPPTPPAPPTAKKKLSPLAWVAIGCIGLIVLAGILFAIGGAFVFSKAKQKLGDFEKNPAMAAAELVVRANPELELVESDPDAQTLTIRNKETGEVLTLDLEDVQKGRIAFKSGDEESTITFGGSGEEGSLTVTGEGGETTFRVGAGGAADIPDWVPVYPGSEAANTYRMTAGDETTGGFSLTTEDSPQEVLDFYGPVVSGLGAEVQRSTFSTGDTEGGILSGGTPDERRRLNVTVSGSAGETTVTVTFTEKP